MLAGLVVAAVVSVPYVALTPGPTLNTLGAPSGKPLIQITGRRTYPTTGNLNLVTVSYSGGPGTDFNIFSALRAWLTPDDAVVPETEIYESGQTQQQVVQQDDQLMLGSQQDAIAAALCYLHIGFKTVIQSTVKGFPAYGVLQPGDQILAVDGTPISCQNHVLTLIQRRKPGALVSMTFIRHGTTETVSLATKDVSRKAMVGIQLAYDFPFSVKINLPGVGGPSAGLMFALGIIDKLTPDNLTGGRFIAGTGEIVGTGETGATGSVLPIGGIQQKMAGARSAGATIFLTPVLNCPDTVGAVPAGLRLVKVSSLAGAIAELEAIQKGEPVPSC